MTFEISEWDRVFRLKEADRCAYVHWTKFPTKSDSTSYRHLMRSPEGRTAYCVFVACVQFAARKRSNGVLPDDIHDELVLMTGMDADTIRQSLSILTSDRVKWVFASQSPFSPGCCPVYKRAPLGTGASISLSSSDSASSSEGEMQEGKQVRNPTGSWNLHASKLVAMFPEALKGGPTKAMKAAANALATVNVTHNGQAFAWLSERVQAYVKSPMAKSEAAVWAPTFFSDEWYNRESFPAPNKTGRKGGPTEVVEDTTAYGAH